MSETVETPPDVEAAARAMGWSPKETWRGDPEKWVDAEAFVKRGEEILPILKHNNQQLLADIGKTKRELDAEKARREALETQVKELAAFQAEEVARQVKAKTTELRKQIREAREAGNTALEDSLEDELEEVRAKPPAPKPAATAPPPAPEAPHPDYIAWAARHSDWWNVDPELTNLAHGVAIKLRAEQPTLINKAFYDEVDKRMARYTQPAPRPSKVESGSGEGSGGGGGNGRTFADLPAEAKEVCNADAKRFVGKDKLFADTKAWQAHYASVYFGKQA